jgi:hypothetical protein
MKRVRKMKKMKRRKRVKKRKEQGRSHQKAQDLTVYEYKLSTDVEFALI